MNCRMAELASALSRAGFEDVKTLLSSGNATFTAEVQSEKALARRAEQAMEEHLERSFVTHVRSVASLRKLLESAPFDAFSLPSGAKRVVTFLREPPPTKPKLPVEVDGARILTLKGDVALAAYVPSPKGPAFMTLLEKTFGKTITTRTWDTVAKCAK
jgi:uncharacterized protein (DUF1697 family)